MRRFHGIFTSGGVAIEKIGLLPGHGPGTARLQAPRTNNSQGGAVPARKLRIVIVCSAIAVAVMSYASVSSASAPRAHAAGATISGAGSTFAARDAGIRLALSAIASRMAAAAPSDNGSWMLTP